MNKDENTLEQNQEINFKYKSIQISSNSSINYEGKRNYRTVYTQDEIQSLYLDVEIINKQFDEKDWNADIVFGLFEIKGEEAQLVTQKGGSITIPKTQNTFTLTAIFSDDDIEILKENQGEYKIQVIINNMAGVSESIHVIESHPKIEDYFEIIGLGISKANENPDQTVGVTAFKSFNYDTLTGLNFFFIASNKLAYKWTYEYRIKITDERGTVKIDQTIYSSHYIKDKENNSFISFLFELGNEKNNIWIKGNYKLELFCFEKLIYTLDFEIGNKDIPFIFTPQKYQNDPQQTESPNNTPDLYDLVGLRKVKEEITKILELADFIKLRRNNGFNDDWPNFNMLFIGNPGTGKKTVAQILAEKFSEKGITAEPEISFYTKDEFPDNRQQIAEILKSNTGKVIYIENAQEFYPTNDPNDKSYSVLQILLEIIINDEPSTIVILSGYGNELELMAGGIPEIKTCFPHQMRFDNYTPEELLEITNRMLDEKEYKFTPKAKDKFFDLLSEKCSISDPDFNNVLFVEETLEGIINNMARRLVGQNQSSLTKEEMSMIKQEDILVPNTSNINNYIQRIERLVEDEKLKTSIINYINYTYFIRERQKLGIKDQIPPLHLITTGNEGTGKSEMISILGEVLHDTGILETPHVFIKSRGEIAGDGTIAPQQMALYTFEQTRGGILYIENAQTLFYDNIGLLAFNTILGQLSEIEMNDTLVVMSGKKEELNKIIKKNPKLKLLFPYQFDFEDLTYDQMYRLAVEKIKEKNFTMHPKAGDGLKNIFKTALSDKNVEKLTPLFIDKVVNNTIQNLSVRVMENKTDKKLTRKQVNTIMLADIPKINSLIIENETIQFNESEIKTALKDLDKMVGQKKMKSQIADFVHLACEYNKQGIRPETRLSLQWCFTGNSGMGKGTVARIIARIYKAMGLIERNSVTVFRVERLLDVAEEEAVQSIGLSLLQSKGGIFFYDEDSNKLNDMQVFKERMRTILNAHIAQKPDDYTIIYARQEKNIQLINEDIEKVSDMINILVFEEYTKEELMEILKRDLATENTKMTRTAQQHMTAFIEELINNKKQKYPSARLIKLVAEIMLRNKFQRQAKNGIINNKDKNNSITKEDVDMFNQEMLYNLTGGKKKIGF